MMEFLPLAILLGFIFYYRKGFLGAFKVMKRSGAVSRNPELVRLCKDCKGIVSKSVKTCPHCGAKQPQPTSMFTWLVVVFIGASAFVYESSENERRERISAMTPAQRAAAVEQAKDREVRSDAKWACREFVQAKLKAPATAKFQSYSDFSISRSFEVEDEYTVGGYVDAQNSYGAMMRTNFTCRVKGIGKSWIPVEIKTGL